MHDVLNQSGKLLVAGTGPAGLIAALALARIGTPVVLVGPAPSVQDRRTTALMGPALALLDGLDVLGELRAQAAPLVTMRIVDATKRLVRSPLVAFRASEIGEEYFGLNIPNSVLNSVLSSAVDSHDGIDWRRSTVSSWETRTDAVTARLADGDFVETRLAVAADGRLSPARDAAGIKTVARTYPQSALVLNFSHSRPHGFISTEFHTETGPFTQVPLPGNRSSLVWVAKPNDAEALSNLDDASLSVRIEDKMQSMLGKVAVEPGRQIYPLGSIVPTCFAQNRIALVGEAGHVFPPIGAQGLNLGIRDIRDLVRVVDQHSGDPGSSRAMTAYDSLRRPDVVARAGAVNLLNLSLLSDMLPAQMARMATLGLVGSLPPLRSLFMREGMQPGSGFARVVTSLREQVRR